MVDKVTDKKIENGKQVDEKQSYYLLDKCTTSAGIIKIDKDDPRIHTVLDSPAGIVIKEGGKNTLYKVFTTSPARAFELAETLRVRKIAALRKQIKNLDDLVVKIQIDDK